MGATAPTVIPALLSGHVEARAELKERAQRVAKEAQLKLDTDD